MKKRDNHIRMSHDPRQTVEYEPDPDPENEATYEQANIRNEKLLMKCIEFCNTGQILQFDDGENDDGKFQLFRVFASSYGEVSPPWPFKILIGENAEIWHAVG